MFISNLKPVVQFCVAFALLASAVAHAEEDPSKVVLDQTEPPARAWRIAPAASVSLPQPLMLGVEIRQAVDNGVRYFSDAGYVRIPFGAEKSVKLLTVQAGSRYFPWKNWFFLTAAVGYRWISFSSDISSLKLDDEPLATGGTIRLSTFYVAPGLGGNFRLSERLSLGFDVGLQIPVLGSGMMNLEDRNTGQDSSSSSLLRVDSSSSMSRIAKLWLPQVTLFRFTYLLD